MLKNKKIKVTFIQRKILHYRIDFFNMLNIEYDINVIHAGNKVNGNFSQDIEEYVNIKGFLWVKKLFRKINSSDIIVFPFDIHWLQIILIALFRQNKKLIFWGHGFSKSAVVNKLKLFLLKKADALIVYMPKGKDKIINTDIILKDKIFIAYNSMLVSNASPQNHDEKKNSFLFVGRLQKRKKIDELILAFNKNIDSFSKDIFVRIVGDGEEIEKLQELVKKLDLNNRVLFEGEVTDENLLKSFFHEAIAYVSPGPIGLGVIHSFSYGTPVIVSPDCKHGPEFENLKNNVNALYYDGTVDSLSQTLINIHINNMLQQSLSNNAYAYYTTYCSMNQMLENFIQVFKFSLGDKK